MKKLLTLLLVFVFTCSLSACQEETNKYCSYCGAGVYGGAIYCGNCGKKVGEGEVETQKQDSSSTKKESTSDTCKKSGCWYRTTFNSNYCSLHTCNSLNCYEMVAGNSIYDSYCSDHACEKSGCSSEKAYRSDYCSSHTCNEAACYEMVVCNSSYCVEHKCKKSGCTSAARYNSDYCYLHS